MARKKKDATTKKAVSASLNQDVDLTVDRSGSVVPYLPAEPMPISGVYPVQGRENWVAFRVSGASAILASFMNISAEALSELIDSIDVDAKPDSDIFVYINSVSKEFSFGAGALVHGEDEVAVIEQIADSFTQYVSEGEKPEGYNETVTELIEHKGGEYLDSVHDRFRTEQGGSIPVRSDLSDESRQLTMGFIQDLPAPLSGRDHQTCEDLLLRVTGVSTTSKHFSAIIVDGANSDTLETADLHFNSDDWKLQLKLFLAGISGRAISCSAEINYRPNSKQAKGTVTEFSEEALYLPGERWVKSLFRFVNREKAANDDLHTQAG